MSAARRRTRRQGQIHPPQHRPRSGSSPRRRRSRAPSACLRAAQGAPERPPLPCVRRPVLRMITCCISGRRTVGWCAASVNRRGLGTLRSVHTQRLAGPIGVRPLRRSTQRLHVTCRPTSGVDGSSRASRGCAPPHDDSHNQAARRDYRKKLIHRLGASCLSPVNN